MNKTVDVLLNHIWVSSELAAKREKDPVVRADIWCCSEIVFSDAMLYLQRDGFKDTDEFKRASRFQVQARNRELTELKIIIKTQKQKPPESR